MAGEDLRSRLQRLEPNMYARFISAENKLKGLLEYSQGGGHLSFTPHGLSHISKLEASYDWLLTDGDREGFNETEIFVLLLATYTHDMLMIPRHVGDESRARMGHAQDVEEFLGRNLGLGVEPHEAQTVSDVVRGHHVYDLDEIPARRIIGSKAVDIRKLAACLSLADICHADSSRAPQIVFDHLNLDEESAYHWRRHLQVSGITRVGKRLVMSASSFSDEGADAVKGYATMIEDQLHICRPYFETVLEPIESVDLELVRRNSPVDTRLKFQGNIPRILSLLIDGVYSRSDVFIREVAQNAFDACYLSQAAAFRTHDYFTGRVVISEILDEDDNLVAVRIDDNGIGMSIAEVQDSLLTIASTQAQSERVASLLESTGKSLIATFGIGLLSCLKVAESVSVRTRRRGHVGLELSFRGVDEEIQPSELQQDGFGSTFIIRLKPDSAKQIDVFSSLTHYFLDVRQVSIEYLVAGEELLECGREEVFAESAESGEPVEPSIRSKIGLAATDIEGEGFRATLWIDDNLSADDLRRRDSGTLTVLNDGILVCDEQVASWLPDELGLVSGYINVAAGRVRLSASRDAIQEGEDLQSLQRELSQRSWKIVSSLALASRNRLSPELRSGRSADDVLEGPELACAAVSAIHAAAKRTALVSRQFYDRLSDYSVKTIHGSLVRLRDVFGDGKTVFVVYGRGNTVEPLSEFDGQQLFTERDPVTIMQATLLDGRGERVIWAANWGKSGFRLLEHDLVQAYGATKGVPVVSIVEDDPVKGTVRSLGVSPGVRDEIGSAVKFVEIDQFLERRAWHLGDELWINVANREMREIYDAAKSGEVDAVGDLLALVELYRADFEALAKRLLRRIVGESS